MFGTILSHFEGNHYLLLRVLLHHSFPFGFVRFTHFLIFWPCSHMRARWRCVCGCGEFDSQGGYTALMYAAERGYIGCVRQLIDAGADKEAKASVRIGRCFAEAPLYYFSSLIVILDYFSFA